MQRPPSSEGLDVVVPVRRPAATARLLEALAQGTRRPDLVTLVGHEVPRSLDPQGLPVRVLRPQSVAYAIGECDVVLRRNVGAWASPMSRLVFLDDDVLPDRRTVESCWRLLERGPVVWGHHRFRDLSGWDVAQVLDLPPQAGRSREAGVNRWHLWMSCYGGMAAFDRDVLIAHGGYDQAYAGRHAGEDQDLGRRLARSLGGTDAVFVHEPPFAWHPERPEPWAPAAWSNVCRGPHDEGTVEEAGVRFTTCARCPWRRAEGALPTDRAEPLLRFDPALVEVEEFAL